MASGVLPICLGEATKLAQFLLDADKEYEVTVCFGVETDTYDAAGGGHRPRRCARGHRGAGRATRWRRFAARSARVPPALLGAQA